MDQLVEIPDRQIDDDDLAALHELLSVLDLEIRPDDEPAPLELRRLRVESRPDDETTTRWLVRRAGGGLRAMAELEVRVGEDNQDLAWFWIGVHPGDRRQGLAKELLAVVLDAARRAGRPKLITQAQKESDGESFLEALGMKDAFLTRESRCMVADVDVELLRSWVTRAEERAAGYELVSWSGPTPDEHLDGYVAVLAVMNTRPKQDLDIEDEVFSPELLRSWEASETAMGQRRVVKLVRHVESGAYVGLTDVILEELRPWRCIQGSTGTDPAHRGLGIGRWLEGAMALELIEQHPSVRVIDTHNNDSNKPMLSINDEMGFRPYVRLTERQSTVDELAAVLAARG